MNRHCAAGLVLAAVLSACASEEAMVPPASEAAVPDTPSAPAPDLAPYPRKLIRTVELDLEVDDTEQAAEAVRRLAESVQGYVSAVRAQRRQQVLHYEITLRVPEGQLDLAVDRLKELAVRVVRESLTTEDVTERYVDLEARLRTLHATESELRELLAESRGRQHKVEDVMAIYKRLTEIRTKIEQLQGQLNALERRVTYSTIRLTLRPTETAKPVVQAQWKPWDTVRSSARALVRILQWLGDFAIVVIVVIVPVVVIIATAVWLLVRLWRAVRRRSRS